MSNDFKDLFGEWPSDPERPGYPFDSVEAGDSPEPENRVRRALDVKECKVVNVYEVCYEGTETEVQSPQNYRATFVLLRDAQGRDLRIFVLPDVAYAMQNALEDQQPERPFTHDLMKNIIERLNGTVERVTIDDLWQDTFYARITITSTVSGSPQTLEIDSRPSDAIALALRFGSPVFVAEAVLAAAQHD